MIFDNKAEEKLAKDNHYEIDYKKNQISICYKDFIKPEFLAEMATTLLLAFPNLQEPTIRFLFKYFHKLGFSPYRIFKSIEAVIENESYSTPAIGSFLKYYHKPTIKFFTFNDLYNNLWSQHKQDWQSYFDQYPEFKLNDLQVYFASTDADFLSECLEENLFNKIRVSK